MAITDSIADGLTIIRNAVRSKAERADLKASYLMTEILKILRNEKFIYDFRLIENKKQGTLRVYLKKKHAPLRRIVRIMKISKPGLRVYKRKAEMPVVLNGLGICIVSTSQGILTGVDATRRGIGGEVLAKIW